MNVQLRITGASNADAFSTYDGVAVHRWGGRVDIVIGDILSDVAESVLDKLDGSLGIVNATFEQSRPDPSLTIASDEWAGFVLLPSDMVKIHKNNAFDPVFSPPHYGIVPSHKDIRLSEMPAGHVSGDLFETIFSNAFCYELRQFTDGDTAKVFFNNQLLSDWIRFFPKVRHAVLSAEAMWPYRCKGCGVQGTINCGVWVGCRLNGQEVCQDSLGVDHLDSIHPYIVSARVVKQLAQMFGRPRRDGRVQYGFGVSQIIDRDSVTGQRILELLPRVSGRIDRKSAVG
jgi:hypothetical protein